MKSSRARFRVVLALVILAVAAGCLYRFHFRARWAVARYKRTLMAGGERLSYEQLVPRPVPIESNAVPRFRQAAVALRRRETILDKNPPPAMRLVAPGKAMVGWKQPDVRGKKTNSWAEAEAELSQDQEAWAALRQIIELPRLDFQLNYPEGPTLRLPHLGPLRNASQRLNALAVCDLHHGRTSAAVLNVRAELALVHAMRDEPLAISQLVRIYMAQVAVTGTWELLQSPEISHSQLAELQRDWAALDFIASCENSIAFERALTESMFAEMRDSENGFERITKLFSNGGPTPLGGPSLARVGQTLVERSFSKGSRLGWKFAWAYPDELRGLRGCQALLDALRQVRAGQTFQAAIAAEQRCLRELGLPPRDQFGEVGWAAQGGPELRRLFGQSVASLERVLHRVLEAESAREITRTAIALRQYQLRHGRYPADLNALVPEFLAAAPRDPVDGNVLRYRLEEDGTFLLYSIGEDGVDNGGNATRTDKSSGFKLSISRPGWLYGRDLVWPRPATLEETSDAMRRPSPEPTDS